MKLITLTIGFFLLIFACNPDSGDGIVFRGKIENRNGEILSNTSVQLVLTTNSLESTMDDLTLDENGHYNETFESLIQNMYTIRPTENNLRLFFGFEDDNTGKSVNSIIGRSIEMDNEWNLSFCKENTLNINFEKISNEYRECEIILSNLEDGSPISGSIIERISIENSDSILQRQICKVDSLYLSWSISDETSFLYEDSKRISVSQFETNSMSIEY